MEDEEVLEEPATKRQRRAGDGAPATAAFPRGTIKLVKLHNFMTYSGTVVIKPGSKLNLVLGPNGTGKSSLVCALCIGLGGSTKLLGRADNLKDYVQRGCDEAWTEITLSGGPGQRDMVVRRDIKQVRRDDGASGYSSKWRLNGRDVNQAEVHDLISGLNIQFDNLCQFLPQDRVVEFARMDPYELLQATQKAIGDAHLHDQHQRLIAKREEAKTRGVSLAAQQRQLSKLEAENKALERDAERHRRRQNLQRELEDICKKETWLGVDLKEAQLAEDQEALSLASELLQKHQNEAADDAAPLKAARNRSKKLTQKLERLPRPPALASRRRELASKLKDIEDEISGTADEIAGLQDTRNKRLAEIAKLEQELAAKRQAFDDLPPPVDNKAAIEAVGAEGRQLSDQANEVEAEARNLETRQTHLRNDLIRIKQRLASLDSVKHRRLGAMDARTPGLRGMHEWLEAEKQRGSFAGPVHGPLGLEMVLADQRYAGAVEAACKGMLYDFATTSRADEERITEELKRRGLYPRVHIFEKPLDTAYPALAGSASQYKRFGVQASLADVVRAPQLVMQVLTNGGPALASSFLLENDAHIDELLDSTPIRTVYTTTHEYRVIKASYATDNGRQSNKLWPPTLLGGAGLTVNEEEKRHLELNLQRVESELTEAEAQLQQKQPEQQRLAAELARAQARFASLVKEQQQYHQRRAILHKSILFLENQLTAKRALPDPLDSKPRLEAQRAAATDRHFTILSDLLALAHTQWEGVRERGMLELAQREAEMQVRALESATSERKDKETKLREQVNKVQRMVAASRQAVERARRQAEAEAPLDNALRARLAALPNDGSELRARRNELESEVASIVCNNPRALEEFQERQRAIGGLSREVAEEERGLADLNAEIDALRDAWLPELQRVVGTINTAFGIAFRDIGCVGEVGLDQGNGEDYDKFAVQIRVKFRDSEELQLLTGTRQSGGERSVATILYLLALQGVTVTPFRVVDEINQGMDPINERKVFGQLVAASCKEGTPQCFLLTPKLLPDLEYGHDITVLQLINGGLEEGDGSGRAPQAWDLADLIGARAMVAAR